MVCEARGRVQCTFYLSGVSFFALIHGYNIHIVKKGYGCDEWIYDVSTYGDGAGSH